MPQVYPSQVVAFIKRIVPAIESHRQNQAASWDLTFDYSHAPVLAALVELIDRIPSELMPAEAAKYAELLAAVAAIRMQLNVWIESRNNSSRFGYRKELGDQHPIGLIYRAPVGLPDKLPSRETAHLTFIDDTEFEASLRTDVSSASSALRIGEWKAATVLAGSVIEALLLWELQQHSPDSIPKIRSGPVNDWYLSDYIKAVRQLRCLRKDTATDIEKARDYRNLIHRGASLRKEQVCDLGTAHIAVGALDHVIRDLQARICPRWVGLSPQGG